MNVVVIVPTYNEKDNIERLIKQIFKVSRSIKNHQISVLVVDDNSPDGTAQIVTNLQKKYKRLYLITGEKEGLGKAYLRGMDYASKKLNAEVMFEHDADFSHDPNEIPNFLKKIDAGYDLVIGSRYIPGGSIPANWGVHRIIFSVVGNWLVRTALLHFNHHDWTTGYRAIRTPLYKKIRKELDDFKGYTFQVSFLHKAFLNNARVAETPIHFKDRVHGESKIGSEYIINLLKYLIETNIKNPPRQLRFVIVGTTGFLVQTTIFTIVWKIIGIEPSLATIVGAEFAIMSNFILNNFWTFSDRKLDRKISVLIPKFISFNVLSFGSPIIQWITVKTTNTYISTTDLATWIAYITGIFIGLVVNYLVYSKIIWRKKV